MNRTLRSHGRSWPGLARWFGGCVLALTLTTAPDALAGVRAQLEAFAEGLDSLTGRFEQITVDETGRVVEEASGRLEYLAPNRFRWDYEVPFPQQIVADGERLWHYDESLEQVTVRPQPAPEQSPLLVMMQPELLERYYRLAADDERSVLEFVPLDESADFERARLHFDDGVPGRLEFTDSFGQQTRIELLSLQRNPGLPADRFSFEVPDGIDLLEGY
ncbi:MAG: outer membrane lipoprotein chaperone LolA [Pseudomonadota bacterium]|nr:MAG: outer membrane lipoprotein chaperone LolA [Pseudomonadota bacterium]